MSERAQVTAAEVARMAGVGRAAVSNWRRRHPDFPEPVLSAGGAPVFHRAEVEQWLRRQGKLALSEPADELWRALDAGRGDTEVLRLVTDVIRAARGDEVTLPADVRVALERAREETGEFDRLVESVCARLFDRQQRQHLATPIELAELMAELAAPLGEVVFDPACGPGNVLRAAAAAGARRLLGQELDADLARLAHARLSCAVHTDDDEAVHIASGDALRADAFPELRADTVLCDPPFGYRDWGHEELAVDPRWEYGFPVKGEPELAWTQHCLAHAKPGGTVVLVLPAGVASRRAGRAIRQALVRQGVVRAVIALPAGVLMSTGIAIHLWVLRNPATAGADPVLLVDLSDHQPPRRGQADWDTLRNEALDAWWRFQADGKVDEIPGRRRVVEPIELLDEDVDLTPARHLPPEPVELDLSAVEKARDELDRALAGLGELLPTVRASTPGARTHTTIGDLVRAGALTLRTHTGALDIDEDAAGPLVLTGRDVATGNAPTARLTDPSEQVTWLEPGDLVVPQVSAGDGHPRVRIIREDEELVLGPNLHLVRVDGARLDVRFLAGQISAGPPGRATSATMSGVLRLDVRRIEIPVLDLEQQRRLGAAFEQLATFERRLRHATELGTDLAHQLAEGLAAGAAEPEE